MPVLLHVVPERRLGLIRLEGTVLKTENNAARRRIEAWLDEGRIERLLVDARSFADTDIMAAGIHGMAVTMSATAAAGDVRLDVAFIATGSSFGYGMARVFHSFSTDLTHLDVTVHEDCADALRALGLPGDSGRWLDTLASEGRRIG